MQPASHSFGGTDRFQLKRVIGRGGMGVVYEAFDRVEERDVAIKLLPQVTPDRLLRFKREFRAAAELHHENLVRLGELIAHGETWFFTMELVHGEDIVSHVRGYPVERGGPSSSRGGSEDTSAADMTEPATMSTAVPFAADEELRMRRALSQLASGLNALHEAGSVHRDVKPSNVMVTPEGRVVLLDFGLASLSGQDTTLFGAGTPLYMAPEQATGPVGVPADWYSFGVLMFELLTGSLPFRGSSELVMLAKQGGRAPVVRARNSAAPRDLASLCDALLSADPKLRPGASEVLRCLRNTHSGLCEHPPAATRDFLLGREREGNELSSVFEEVRRSERPIALIVCGESGIGKSTLARGFAETLTEPRRALVFSGRCYERELVPYKAIDDIMDAISQWLRHQRRGEVEALMPRHAGVLSRVFPVLARVGAIARSDPPAPTMDEQQLRSLLFTAARELLVNVARELPLLLVIDDLQWADRDSLALLSELCSDESPARIMLLCTVRTSVSQRAPERLLASGVDERSLVLGPLSAQACAKLAEQWLAAAAVADVDARELIAESGGHPLFLRELVRQLASNLDRPEVLTLDGVLRGRMATLGEGASRLLRLIALAGAPRPSAALAEACQLSAHALAEARHALRAAGFVLVLGEGGEERLDASHDRVRHAARADLTEAQTRALHAQLGEILERRSDYAGAALHFREAGEPQRAARHHLRAAERASASLAFVDAVEHYAAATALGEFSDDEARALRIRHADALSRAGRGRAAAELYRQAAQGRAQEEAIELKRRAASELMRSGYLEEGRAAAGEVLAQVGLHFSRTPLLSLLLRRFQLWLRGLRYREVEASRIEPRRLDRIDLCWSMSTALVATDHLQGAYLQARGVMMALRTGEPSRIARAIAAEAAFYAGFGSRAHKRVYQLIDVADSIAARLGDPRLVATVSLLAGTAAHLGGRFAEAKAHLTRANGLLRAHAGVWWELDFCRQFWLEGTFYLGELSGFASAVASMLKEAEERGLRSALVNLRTGLPNAAWLIRDEPDRATELCDRALGEWSARGFHVQHWYQLMSATQIELYRGRGEHALSRIEAGWREISRAHLPSHTRIAATHLRARAALSAAREGQRTARLGLARKMARALAREKTPWASALSAVIATSADKLSGQEPSATRLGYLRGELERSDLRVYALAIDCAQAGSESPATGLARCGVVEPEKFARMLLPGLIDG